MKQYTLFLIYAIGRDELDFWKKMEYDLAFEQVQKAYKEFLKWEKHQPKKQDLYGLVHQFIRGQMSDDIKI